MTCDWRTRAFASGFAFAVTIASTLILTLTLMSPTAFAQQAETAAEAEAEGWPPPLPGLAEGTVTLETEAFLEIPESVKQRMQESCENEKGPEGPAPFIVADVPPRVEVALHGNLPHNGRNGTGWSSWGGIDVDAAGRVYMGIGDHGDDAAGTANAYIYEWNPQTHALKQVMDVNAVGPREGGEPTWSKVHARVSAAPDGWIYFTGTLGDGQQADEDRYHWTDTFPGGQLLRYNPETGESEVFANLPNGRVTATSRIDPIHNRWWCNLEVGDEANKRFPDARFADAMFALDLSTGKPVFQSADGVVSMNREFALAADGAAIFNGAVPGELWRADVETGKITKLDVTFPAALRSATRESSDGYIYGVCGVPYGKGPRPGELFRYDVDTGEVELYGPEWLCGSYTPITILSPDERFLYYMPGGHGGAKDFGTPLIQYHIATGQRKVIAFLRAPIERRHEYIPGGTYGTAISADGRTIYANLNGQPTEAYRPEIRKRLTGFGTTSFVAIHIPEAELREPEIE